MKNRMQRRDFLRSGLVLGGAGMLPMPLWAMNLPALATRLHAGPMLGYPAYRSATVWVQTLGPAQVQIRYQAQDGKGAVQHSETVQTDAGNFYSVNIVLDELQPDTRYQTQLLLNNQVLPSPGPLLRTPSLWKFRAPAPDFKVLTGSCAYINDPRYDRPGKPYGGGYEIYEPMRQEQADLMIWLGDNLYFREADFASPAGMALRYWSDRAFAPLQRFLNSTPQIAIWDDHDYGPNDSDSSFIFKETALRLFQSYWPNPSFGLPGTPGVFTQQSVYDADFFLLDDRWYRDADAAAASRGKVMFGKTQLDWLKNALLSSHARFKFIAAGGQMLNDDDAYEGWNLYPEERQDFLDWLANNQIRGVIFLSGDRHISELMRRPRPRYSGKHVYPLWEITSSPLNSGPAKGDHNPYRVPGTLVQERNYCSLAFHGQGADRQVLVSCKDVHGRTLWQHPITSRDLGYDSA
ncbi:alkaline phosphatase D family protein [Acidithiobacillus sp. YTS05]|nr:alkaline phosphatase D family protein [Igneacidithiobacillus copahuensis]UTV81640.1 alkaline phosphatase D family protein [Acidithiobacillus sp. YTS05]